MPTVSPKQHRTMEMAEHNPEQAAKYGIHIPKKVAHEFNQADIGRYASGGLVGKTRTSDIPQVRLPFLRRLARSLS